EVHVLAREVTGERLVRRDRVVGVAAGEPEGRRDLVAVGEAEAEPRPDALAVPRRHLRAARRRLVVEALVAEPDVAEQGRAREPVGERRLRLLRRLGDGRAGLLDLLLRRLPDGLLLLDHRLQLLELLLRLPELLFQHPDPLLRRHRAACRRSGENGTERDRERPPGRAHRSSLVWIANRRKPTASPGTRTRFTESSRARRTTDAAERARREDRAEHGARGPRIGELERDDPALLQVEREPVGRSREEERDERREPGLVPDERHARAAEERAQRAKHLGGRRALRERGELARRRRPAERRGDDRRRLRR